MGFVFIVFLFTPISVECLGPLSLVTWPILQHPFLGEFLSSTKEETKTIHDDEKEEVEEKKKVDGVGRQGSLNGTHFLKGIKIDANLW